MLDTNYCENRCIVRRDVADLTRGEWASLWARSIDKAQMCDGGGKAKRGVKR